MANRVFMQHSFHLFSILTSRPFPNRILKQIIASGESTLGFSPRPTCDKSFSILQMRLATSGHSAILQSEHPREAQKLMKMLQKIGG